jgi:predicted dinucleotide-binding enzyme
MPSLRIAILGAAVIGHTLGSRWAKAGHSVAFGVKHPTQERAEHLRKELGEQVSLSTPDEALVKGDIVVLAVPGSAVEEVITTYAELLDHKIIIDATNKFRNLEKFLVTRIWDKSETKNSLATLQENVPHAQVYRAFNSYGWEPFADPIFEGIQADLFYCGPDGQTRAVIEQLITEIGLQPVYLGGTDQIEVVDNILWLWSNLAHNQKKGRNLALKVLTR